MERIKYNDIKKEFSKNPEKYIEKCESVFDSFLEKCANRVKNDGIERIFLCGQSASGKTTTASRLSQKLNDMGRKCHIIELDNFFLPSSKQHINRSGTPDFESIFALDLNEIYEFSKNIKSGKPVAVPQFNFKAKNEQKKTSILIEKEDILIIEGIHAYNNRILKAFGEDRKCLNIFVTINSCVDFENTSLTNNDLRFARRLIRDYHYRNANPDWTIDLWHMVRAGEKRYSGGYIKKADIIFNTFINYEIFLLKEDFMYLSDMGAKTAQSKGYYKSLLKKYFLIENDIKVNVPKDSILNEFIKK